MKVAQLTALLIPLDPALVIGNVMKKKCFIGTPFEQGLENGKPLRKSEKQKKRWHAAKLQREVFGVV
jgi:hypothetical protein